VRWPSQIPAVGHLPAAPTELPRIRSERPAFELHYPHLVERLRTEAHTGRRSPPARPI